LVSNKGGPFLKLVTNLHRPHDDDDGGTDSGLDVLHGLSSGAWIWPYGIATYTTDYSSDYSTYTDYTTSFDASASNVVDWNTASSTYSRS